MRRFILLSVPLFAGLTLSACTTTSAPTAQATHTPSVITVPHPGSLSDAELSERYGGPVLLRTDTFALIGSEAQGLSTQSVRGGIRERNRGVMRVPQMAGASGTTGYWASGSAGYWASGSAGYWASGSTGYWANGSTGYWANGSFQPLPQNDGNWQQIKLEAAHRTLTDLGRGVTVAVLDTGVDLTHPIFAKSLSDPSTWRDFVDGDTQPNDAGTLGTGLTGHGTEVAGIVLQIAPGATILPVRVLGSDGTGDVADVARGIVWAADHGADIINLSLGSASGSVAITQAVQYANARGVAVAASGGNNGGQGLDYPAQDFTHSGLNIAVGSVDNADRKSAFSQYGPALDLLAPGERVYGPAPENRMAVWSGTSMSAPVVSGALALGLARESSVSTVTSLLRSSAVSVDTLNTGYGSMLGEGRLDLDRFAAALSAH